MKGVDAVSGTAFGGILAVLFMLVFQLMGVCAARCLLPNESAGARLLLGSVFGSTAMHWLPVIFAFFLGFTSVAHACAAAVAVVISAVSLRFCKASGKPACFSALSAFKSRKFLFAVAAVWLFFGVLVWRSFLFEDGKIYSGQATYGDMSMHLSFITSLAEQGTFPPNYSLLPQFRLSYPFLSDSISSSLYLLGAPLKLAYFLPMLLAGAQVMFGFYLLAMRLLGSSKKAAAAWLLFFFNGGFGFVYFLSGEKTLHELLFGFYKTPTNLIEKNIRWVNVIVDMMLPQRATLFGWAVLVPTLYLLYRAAFENEKRYFLVGGVLCGLLPMIHTHSFLAAALVCAMWLLFWLLRGISCEDRGAGIAKLMVLLGLPIMSLLRTLLAGSADSNAFLLAAAVLAVIFISLLLWLAVKNARMFGFGKLFTAWGVLLVVTCALALPQLFYWTFRQVGDNGMLRGHFGWVITDSADGYLWFYLKNIGLTAIFALLGLLSAKSNAFAKYSPALLIWLVAELVEFQPNNYDNNKLLYVAFAFLCFSAAELLSSFFVLLKNRPLKITAMAAVFVVCASSAVLTMARELVAKYELFGSGAISVCSFVEANTAPDSTILTNTRHNNELAALSGRNIVCGSPSYLYYHGLPYQSSETAVCQMYENPKASQALFEKYKVDYILVSDFERSSYQVDEAAIAEMFEKIYDDGVRALYQVTKGGMTQ